MPCVSGSTFHWLNCRVEKNQEEPGCGPLCKLGLPQRSRAPKGTSEQPELQALIQGSVWGLSDQSDQSTFPPFPHQHIGPEPGTWAGGSFLCISRAWPLLREASPTALSVLCLLLARAVTPVQPSLCLDFWGKPRVHHCPVQEAKSWNTKLGTTWVVSPINREMVWCWLSHSGTGNKITNVRGWRMVILAHQSTTSDSSQAADYLMRWTGGPGQACWGEPVRASSLLLFYVIRS